MGGGDAGGAERGVEERHREEAVDVADGEQRGGGDVQAAQHGRDRADLRAVGRREPVEHREPRAVAQRHARRRERHKRGLCACWICERGCVLVRKWRTVTNDVGKGAGDELDLGAAVGADDEAAAGREERACARDDVTGRVVRVHELDLLCARPLAPHVLGSGTERAVQLCVVLFGVCK